MNASQKLEIHELLSRAAYSFDERDLEALAGCFAEDATMRVQIADGTTFGPFEGRDAIMQLMKTTLDSQTDMRRHVISNFIFDEEESESAKVISTVLVFSAGPNRIETVTSGVYTDRVERREGCWRIADRDLSLELGF